MIQIMQQLLEIFIDNESDNILSGVSERNLCGRLAIILEKIIQENDIDGYYADTEYNRKQEGQIKTILDGDMKNIVINCDLILHSRGKNISRDNLIAIEMKKSYRPKSEKTSDRTRLRAMTKKSYDNIWSNDGTTHPEYVCGYELGSFIEIDKDERTIKVEYFESGDLIDTIYLTF